MYQPCTNHKVCFPNTSNKDYDADKACVKHTETLKNMPVTHAYVHRQAQRTAPEIKH